MNDASRAQGGLICIAVVVVGAVFLLGLLQQSYWALALPVALVVFFALGAVVYSYRDVANRHRAKAEAWAARHGGDQHGGH